MTTGIQTKGRGFSLQDSAYVDNIAYGNNGSFATLIANAGGGQAGAKAMPPTALMINVGTVATAGDSVSLPFAQAGLFKMVTNPTVNSLNVFGQSGTNRQTGNTDTINGTAGSTAYAIAAGKSVLFFCAANGNWSALLSA